MLLWSNIKYILSTHTKEKWPHHNLSEIIIVGRSNVGKSTLINTLSNNSKLAKVSKQPGKTRSLNFFNVENKFYFVDVPGYGFSKVSLHQKELFSKMIEEYLKERKNLKLAIQLLDIRREPNEDDLLMINFFKKSNIPILYVMTKSDKVNQSEKYKSINKVINILRIDKKDLLIISSFKKNGIDNLKNKIIKYI